MDQITDAERVEHQGLGAAFRHAPAEPINPHEAQRVAQQTPERAGRLGAGQDREDQRMIGPGEAIMRRDLVAPPVVPAILRADRLRIGAELLWPAHEAVGFAESMHGHSVAAEIVLVAMPGEEGATSQKASVAVAPGAREDDFTGGGGQDGLEVPTIREAHRKRIEARPSI